MNATGGSPVAELPDWPSAPGNEKKDRAVPHTSISQRLPLVEDLVAVQTHNELVGIHTIRIEGGKRCELYRPHGFGWRGVDANRVPEVCNLDADVQHGLAVRCQLDNHAICAKTSDKRRSCHAAEVAGDTAGCGSGLLEPGAGGRVLRKRAIC